MEEKVRKLATATLVSGAMLLAANKPNVKNKRHNNLKLLKRKLKLMLIKLKAKETMQSLKLMKHKIMLTMLISKLQKLNQKLIKQLKLIMKLRNYKNKQLLNILMM